ncbi:MAG: M15 family metallopeptidase [Anaerocolumna sp.]
MKRKLNLLILLFLILLILFMANVISKSDNNGFSPEPYASDSDSINSDISGKNKNSDRDILPTDTAAAVSDKTASAGRDSSKETIAVPQTREALRQLSAGTIIDIKEPGAAIMDNCFYYEDINDDIKARIIGKSYKEDCTVPFGDLRYVRILYYGFDKETHIGELIVNKAIASDIVDIFAELYDKKYPIERMVLVDEYNANDNASMAADNTSSFNYRSVPGSTHLSKHALGLAIDINPLYNPYIQYNKDETVILPVEGSEYADRTLNCPYYIKEDDLCYKAFTKRGFTWGGFWKTEPDYQHFQKTLD